MNISENNEKEKRKQEDRIKIGKLKFGLVGWEDFIFEKYNIFPGHKTIFDECCSFNPCENNFYIFGKCGVGKTHLAYATAHKWYDNKYKIKIIKQFELSRMLRMRDPREEEELINELSKFEVLLIDDLGVGKSTEFANQILYEIIEKRIMNRQHGLIITSNLSPDEFSEKCGDDRISSRIFGLCDVFKLEGDDFRLNNAK